MVHFRRLVVENIRDKNRHVRYLQGKNGCANDTLNRYQYQMIGIETVIHRNILSEPFTMNQLKWTFEYLLETKRDIITHFILKSLRTVITKRNERGYLGTKSF